MPRDRGLLRRARPEQPKPGWELRGAGCAVVNKGKWSGGHVVLDRDAFVFAIGPGNRVPLDSAAHAAWQSQRAAELRLRRAQQRDTDHRDSEQRRVAALAARPDADAWTWLDAHGLRGFEDRERAPPQPWAEQPQACAPPPPPPPSWARSVLADAVDASRGVFTAKRQCAVPASAVNTARLMTDSCEHCQMKEARCFELRRLERSLAELRAARPGDAKRGLPRTAHVDPLREQVAAEVHRLGAALGAAWRLAHPHRRSAEAGRWRDELRRRAAAAEAAAAAAEAAAAAARRGAALRDTLCGLSGGPRAPPTRAPRLGTFRRRPDADRLARAERARRCVVAAAEEGARAELRDAERRACSARALVAGTFAPIRAFSSALCKKLS